VTACFQNETVPAGWPEHLELIDHRYFYHDDYDIGGYTCGLVRNAVANRLLEVDRNFVHTDFLASLGDFVGNRSVIGFIMNTLSSHPSSPRVYIPVREAKTACG